MYSAWAPETVLKNDLGGDFLLFLQEQMFADDLENEVWYIALKCNRTMKQGNDYWIFEMVFKAMEGRKAMYKG